MKKRTIKIISFSIIAVFAITFLVLNLPTRIGGNTRYEPVLSGSMEPAIPVGGLVLIKPVEPTFLKVGDIICYRFSDERLVTHRIIEISSKGYITKGDANEEADPKLVKENDIIGAVVLTVPFVGHLGTIVQTPIGFLLLIFIPGIVFIILEIREVIISIKKPKIPA